MCAAATPAEQLVEPIGEQTENEVVVAHALGRQPDADEAGLLGRRRGEIRFRIGLEDVEPTRGVGPNVEPDQRLEVELLEDRPTELVEPGVNLSIGLGGQESRAIGGDRPLIHGREDPLVPVEPTFYRREGERSVKANEPSTPGDHGTGDRNAIFRAGQERLDQNVVVGGRVDLGDRLLEIGDVLDHAYVVGRPDTGFTTKGPE